MTRGIRAFALAVTAIASTVAVPAAHAAPSPYVVYEVVHVKPGGPAKVMVWVTQQATTGTGVSAIMLLRPDRESGGYHVSTMGIATSSASGGGVRTYGWPAPVPPCTGCTPATLSGSFGMGTPFQPGPKDRILAAGPRGKVTVKVENPYWRVRETTAVGIRTVMADHSAATGVDAQGWAAEVFTSATAPGGRYGSASFGEVPCEDAGAGTATLRADGDSGSNHSVTCGPLFGNIAFGETLDGRAWSLTGNVVGDTTSALRLLVFDFPKPR
jgi:hypothetical protein